MSSDRPVIEVQRICKTFGRHQALNDVNFTVHESEMVALIGPSGSGKSTLLKNIAGLSHADRRTGCCVLLRGEPIQRNGRLERGVRRRRARIGYIFQQFNLVGRLSVLTNVLIGSLGRMPRWRGNLTWFTRDETREALRALARVGLERVALQRASTLSGGQQQRVAIARALMQEADVILADEPIASLDPQSARNVMEILTAINREDGTTVVVSLHQVEYARRYCRRVLALKDGVIHFDSAVGNLSDKRLIELYGPDILLAEDMDAPRHAPASAARRREQAELASAAL